ncbi:MAG: glycosyltransferase family 2 protein [Deltaproteobacteria bacterium]|nr:glycosyltransferase family 2 protein [Deltaproteobacteria bacterium]
MAEQPRLSLADAGGRPSSPIPVSVAIITRDEEERLPGCLASLGFADEIVVVDSGSVDRTIEIAASYGARVLNEEWRGFSGQKQLAVDLCRHDWVLILDADERIPPKTATVIREALFLPDPEVAAFGFRRKNYLHGRWVKHCGWWPDRIVRLVDRRRGRFDGRPVHEQWLTEGDERDLKASIEHISFQSYSQLVEKMERYSSLGARELFEKGVKACVFTPLLHSLWMFLKTYGLERGFLDGFDGLVISTMNAGGSFLKYAKLREMWKENLRS